MVITLDGKDPRNNTVFIENENKCGFRITLKNGAGEILDNATSWTINGALALGEAMLKGNRQR